MMVPYIEDLFPDMAPTLATRYARTPRETLKKTS